MERRARLAAIAAMAIMWCATAWGAEQAAPKGAPAGPVQKAPLPHAPGMMVPGSGPKIIVSPWNLTADNMWPESDTRVTLRFQIKNHGQGRVENIPWAIHDASTNRTLKTGTQGALAPSETVTISAVWQPGSGGLHLLQAYVDPSGTALKNTATQTVVTLNVLVPTPGYHFLRVNIAGTGLGRIGGHGGTINCDNSGSRPPAGSGACHVEVGHGTTVQLVAYPYSPYIFGNWSTNCRIVRQNAIEGICEVQVNATTSVSAGFGPR